MEWIVLNAVLLLFFQHLLITVLQFEVFNMQKNCRFDFSFIILAVLCRGVQRVCRAHLRVITAGSTSPFEELWQRWLVVGITVFDSTGLRFEP